MGNSSFSWISLITTENVAIETKCVFGVCCLYEQDKVFELLLGIDWCAMLCIVFKLKWWVHFKGKYGDKVLSYSFYSRNSDMYS